MSTSTEETVYNTSNSQMMEDEDQQQQQNASTMSPEQDGDIEEQRRQLRRKYVALMQETESKKQELCSTDGGNVLEEVFGKGDELFKEVVHSREGALDYQWFKQCTAYAVEKNNRIKVTTQITPQDFIQRLKDKYSSRDDGNASSSASGVNFDWDAAGKDVFKYLRRTPTTSFMYGPLKIEPKERKERKERKKKLVSAEAEEVESVEKQKKTKHETTKRVEQINKKLLALQKKSAASEVNFFDVVVDDKFTTTIENIFYFSFLVKEGHAALHVRDNMIVAASAKPPSEDQFQHGEAQTKQCVLRLDFKTYKKWLSMRSTPLQSSGSEASSSHSMNGHGDGHDHNNNNNNHYEQEEGDGEAEHGQDANPKQKKRPRRAE